MTEDEKQKLNDLHEFFMKPPTPGRPSRAQQIDDALSVIRTGRMSARAVLWMAGVVVACGAAWAQLKGFLK